MESQMSSQSTDLHVVFDKEEDSNLESNETKESGRSR